MKVISISTWAEMLDHTRNVFFLAHSIVQLPEMKKNVVTVRQPLNVMAWVMSYHGLSELHVAPRGRAVTARYYMEEVLTKKATPAMK